MSIKMKWNHPNFVNISPTVVANSLIDRINDKVFTSSCYSMGTQNIDFLWKKKNRRTWVFLLSWFVSIFKLMLWLHIDLYQFLSLCCSCTLICINFYFLSLCCSCSLICLLSHASYPQTLNLVSTYICVNCMHIYVLTSLRHWTFIL